MSVPPAELPPGTPPQDADPPAASAVRPPQRNTLPKAERLWLRDAIQPLFTRSKGFHHQDLRVLYRLVPAAAGQAPVQVLVGAPKRHLRRAHDRNRAKRLLREAYRQHKHPLVHLLASHGAYHLHLAILLNTRQIPPYSSVVERVQGAIVRVHKAVAQALASAS